MTLEKFDQLKKPSILELARQMALAARTAPKARGIDLLAIAIASGETIERLSKKMKEIAERTNSPAGAFARDSVSILETEAIVLLGTKKQTIGLKYCGFCGFPDCASCQTGGGTCVFNPGDLGIAIGSVVSLAADHRLDNRVMYTVGMAALELDLLGPEVKIAFGIPLSATGKNPFFDRR